MAKLPEKKMGKEKGIKTPRQNTVKKKQVADPRSARVDYKAPRKAAGSKGPKKPSAKKGKIGRRYADPAGPGIKKSPLAKDLHGKKKKAVSGFARILKVFGG